MEQASFPEGRLKSIPDSKSLLLTSSIQILDELLFSVDEVIQRHKLFYLTPPIVGEKLKSRSQIQYMEKP
jgi:hypothetical protein